MVQRYDPTVVMQKTDDGDYVEYSEYEALKQQRDALLKACEMAEDWIRSHIVAINRPAKLDKALMDAIILGKPSQSQSSDGEDT